MKTLFLALLLGFTLTQHAFAAKPEPTCPEPRDFSIEGKTLKLCSSEIYGGYISEACLKKSKKICGVVQLLKSVQDKPFDFAEGELGGGRNPGSVLCEKLGGKVLFATLESGSQQTFCESADHSLIDCNAISNAYHSPKKP